MRHMAQGSVLRLKPEMEAVALNVGRGYQSHLKAEGLGVGLRKPNLTKVTVQSFGRHYIDDFDETAPR